METKAIKAEFKDLSLEELIRKKNEISSFLFNHPNLPNNLQGQATILILDKLILAKENSDEFTEGVLKEVFFE